MGVFPQIHLLGYNLAQSAYLWLVQYLLDVEFKYPNDGKKFSKFLTFWGPGPQQTEGLGKVGGKSGLRFHM